MIYPKTIAYDNSRSGFPWAVMDQGKVIEWHSCVENAIHDNPNAVVSRNGYEAYLRDLAALVESKLL